MPNRPPSIVFYCPECDAELKAHPQRAGDDVRCVECGTRVRVPPSKHDPGLSGKEWLLYTLLFLPVPMVNVILSSVLYYVWKGDQPRKANQINLLGFLVFGFHVVVFVLLAIVGAMLNR
jgi:hypothetical protein